MWAMRKIWGWVIERFVRLMATFWAIYARPRSERAAWIYTGVWLGVTSITLLSVVIGLFGGAWDWLNWLIFVFVNIPTLIFDVVILRWCFEGLAYRRWWREQSEKIKTFLVILERNAADDRPEDS
jgi:hypothetical protein